MFLRTQKQLLARIQVSLAGLVAEEIWYGQTTSGPSVRPRERDAERGGVRRACTGWGGA